MNLVARYDGDEFVSVLSDEDQRGAEGYRERIHEDINAHRLPVSHGVTVSSGVAQFEVGQPVGVDELIQAADRNMYENKVAKG